MNTGIVFDIHSDLILITRMVRILRSFQKSWLMFASVGFSALFVVVETAVNVCTPSQCHNHYQLDEKQLSRLLILILFVSAGELV